MSQLERTEPTLDKVGPENLPECGIGCITSLKHQGHAPKTEWLRKRFAEGLRFLLFRDSKGKPLAFLEYVPGEFAWRPVNAEGWLFVHCLWVYPAGQKVGGLGSRLIEACVEEARQARSLGVAAMVGDGPWISGKHVYLKNGFDQVAAYDRFQIVTHQLREAPPPTFRNISAKYTKQKGLHIVYSAQCPMLPKSAHDVSEMAAEHGLDVKVTILESAREAQNAPSHYGVFSLLWNGRLLSDHYVSKGRFKNILKKEILKETG